MRVYSLDFSRLDKSPSIIEDRLNCVLERGKFFHAIHHQNPITGRVHFSIWLVDGHPNVFAKVFREPSSDCVDPELAAFLKEADVILPTQSISAKTNNIFTALFCKKLVTPNETGSKKNRANSSQSLKE